MPEVSNVLNFFASYLYKKVLELGLNFKLTSALFIVSRVVIKVATVSVLVMLGTILTEITFTHCFIY